MARRKGSTKDIRAAKLLVAAAALRAEAEEIEGRDGPVWVSDDYREKALALEEVARHLEFLGAIESGKVDIDYESERRREAEAFSAALKTRC